MIEDNRIAFFDFDGTITRKDSYLAFIKYVKGPWRYRWGLIYFSPQILLYFLKLIPNDRLKQLFFSHFFKGMTAEELQAFGRRFSAEIVPKICYQAALQKIEWHKQHNHRVIILTASSPLWIAPWCATLEIEIIGTEFETIDGRYTGKLKGKNCYGEEKRKIVARLLSEQNYSYTYGYGDTKSDVPFLRLMDASFFGSISEVE